MIDGCCQHGELLTNFCQECLDEDRLAELEEQEESKMKCKKCGKELKKYYYDAGDHFSAGPAPGSGYRYKPCECEKDREKGGKR